MKPHHENLFLRVCSGQSISCYVAKLRGLPWRSAVYNKWGRFSSFGMPFSCMRCGHSTGSKARYVSGRMPQLDHMRDLQWLDQTPIVDGYVLVPLAMAFYLGTAWGMSIISIGTLFPMNVSFYRPYRLFSYYYHRILIMNHSCIITLSLSCLILWPLHSSDRCTYTLTKMCC